MNKSLTIKFFIAAVFIIPLTAYAILSFYENKFQKLPVLGESKEVNGKMLQHTVRDFLMTDQDNKSYSSDNWKNKIVVADFFFTRCPSICPKMTLSLKKVRAAFENDESILISSFTVDPLHDTPAVLKKYAEDYNLKTTGWDFLTGDKKDIYKLARNSFLVTATDGDGGTGDFIHSENLVLIDPMKRIRGYYDGTSLNEVKQLIQDIKKLKNEN